MRTERDGDWTVNYLLQDEVRKIIQAGGGALLMLDEKASTTIRHHTGRAEGLTRQQKLEDFAEKCGIDIQRG